MFVDTTVNVDVVHLPSGPRASCPTHGCLAWFFDQPLEACVNRAASLAFPFLERLVGVQSNVLLERGVAHQKNRFH